MTQTQSQHAGDFIASLLKPYPSPAVQAVHHGPAESSGYPRWIGQKFTADGNLLPFPGNTVICHLPQHNLLFHQLLKLHESLKVQSFASLYTLLPPSSWHMTVFEGVSSHIRKPGMWPADVPLDSTLAECTANFQSKLQKFDLEDDTPFKMRIEGFEPLLDGIALKVVPANVEEETRLRGLRDRLSEGLLTRYPGHGEYSFHISLSYMLRFLCEKDYEDISTFLERWQSQFPDTFELGAPEFCIFNDMFSFQRLAYLEKQS